MIKIAYAILTIAIMGMLVLNMWVAIRLRVSIAKVIFAAFSRAGVYSPAERRIESLLEALTAIGVVTFVAALYIEPSAGWALK